jgi:ubiquinone biosynthesis protein
MFRTLKDILVLMRAARALASYDALLPREYAARVPVSLRLAARLFGSGKRRHAQLSPGQRLAHALEELGPSAIKLGQFLATRPDILGADIARGLETLQDRLPPFPEIEARHIVEAELGRPLNQLFADFGPPVAAASIAQVHQAETSDDPPRRVAVKILRPGIEARFAQDFRAFGLAAVLAERLSTEGRCLAWSTSSIRSHARWRSSSISGWKARQQPSSPRTCVTIFSSACPRSTGHGRGRAC